MTERVHILHVDDNPEFAELAATFLERERESFSVDIAEDAVGGLEMLRETAYDCIVSDYDMPGVSGIELLETVRETYPDLPFVLFTGKGSEEVASEAISAGVTDYLQKGGGSEQYALLANRIENAVQAHRTAERAALREELSRHAELIGETGGWEVDTATGAVHCTVGTERILGVEAGEGPTTVEDAIGWYHPEDRSAVRRAVERARATGEQAAGEWRIQTADGDQRLVEATICPVEENGRVVALRGAIHDITEQREQETRLREEQVFVRQALDALEALFYVVGTNGRLRRWNSRLREVTGHGDGELAAMTATDLFVDADRERVERGISDTLTTGRATIVAEIATADGERVPYELTGSRLTDSAGEPVGLACVGRERATGGEQPELAEMIVTHAPDPAVLVDVTSNTEFHIERVNPAYEALTGLDADRVCGRQPTAVFDDRLGERIAAQYRSCIEQAAPVEYTERRPVDGETRLLETKLAPVIREGRVVALVGLKRELSAGGDARHEGLVEGLPVGVFRATTDGEFVSVNEAMVSLYDAGSRATLCSVGPRTLTAEPSHWGLLLDQLEEHGTVEDKLLRMETVSGETLWVELSLSLVDGADGRYVDGVVREVTGRDRQTPGEDAFELLDGPGSEPLFLVDVDEQLRLRHVDTSHEDTAGDVADLHSGELTAPGDSEGPVLAASQASELRDCVRTRESRTFDGVSPLTGNPIDGTAHVVPVVVDGDVEYLVGVLDRELDRANRVETAALLGDIADLSAASDTDRALERLLERGRDRFGADQGVLARVADSDDLAFRTVASVGEGSLEPSLPDACCRQLLDGDGPPVVADAAGMGGDLTRGSPGWYIGARVAVDGGPDGLVWFGAGEPRGERFTDLDRAAMGLLGRVAGDVLERERLTDLAGRLEGTAGVGAWEYDVRTGETHWTDGVYRVYGLSADLEPGRGRVLDALHPEDRATLREARRTAVEDGQPYRVEVRLMTQSGNSRQVRVRGEPQLTDSGVVRVRGTVQTITESAPTPGDG